MAALNVDEAIFVSKQSRLQSFGVFRYLRHRRDKQGANFTYEIIIVDDGSRDNTSK